MFNTAVIDPDSGALEAMVGLLKKNTNIASVVCFSKYADYMREIENGSIDIAFIRAGSYGFHGLSLAKETLLASPATRVVFVSDTEKYAVIAFEEGASGYLLLPVEQRDLNELMENIRRRDNWRQHKFPSAGMRL